MFTNKWKLTSRVDPEENEFTIKTTDFFRPNLKQIGNSVSEIRDYFVAEGQLNIIPSYLPPYLADIKDELVRRLEDDGVCLFQGQNIATSQIIDSFPDYNVKSGILLVVRSLPVLMNYEARERPDSVICEVILVLPFQPVILLCVVEGDDTSDDLIKYNTSVARGFTSYLIRYLNVDFKPAFGVINTTDIGDTVPFNEKIQDVVRMSRTFLPAETFTMGIDKHGTILTALWASVAETGTVSGSRSGHEYQRFLTKEQCIVLIENINREWVEVTALPKTGATTLMLEVVRRLSQGGKTLLICKSREDEDALRQNHGATTICGSDVDGTDLSQYRYIVDETNSVTSDENTSVWCFQSDHGSAEPEIMDTSVECAGPKHTPDERMDTTGSEEQYMEKEAARKKRRLTTTSPESGDTVHPIKQYIGEDQESETTSVTYTCEDGSGTFSCPKMEYDVCRVNISKCHLNTDKQLINSKLDTESVVQGVGRLQKYWGTCSDPIPLIPNLSPHSPYSSGPQYWEAHTDVKVNKTLQTLPLLEVGISEEQDVDGQFWVCRLPRSWCIRIAVCGNHRKRICTQVWAQGKHVLCLPKADAEHGTIANVDNTTASVGYGVVVDAASGRLGFLDLDRAVVLHRFNIDFKEALFPMFGVGSIQDKVDLKMRLVSGNDIALTEQKKSLIMEALSK